MRKFLSSLLVAMLYFAIAGQAQVLSVTGRITDQKGAPVPSASIVIKGKSANGVAADEQGRFKINASKGDVLVISNVSFTSKEVTVTGTTEMLL